VTGEPTQTAASVRDDDQGVNHAQGRKEGRHERQVAAALEVIDQAYNEHQIDAVFALFSGGHDSLAAAAITSKHPAFTGCAFIDTGTGIPRTVEFVHQTCNRNGWPLTVLHPDGKDYEDLIRDKGFGMGPKAHNTAYYWLKQRQVRRLVSQHKNGLRGRVMLTTGVRRSESSRRMAAAISVPVRRSGAQVWVNPILDWTASDCSRFIDTERLDRNPVVDTLHRSGECLCGTLFNKGDREEILLWAPEMAPIVAEWERIARDAGHRNCVWGVRGQEAPPGQIEAFDSFPLCVSCEARRAA